MREQVKHGGMELILGSYENLCMENSSVSSSDYNFKYDTSDESCDGTKKYTPASNDIYKHVTDSGSSESFSMGTNYEYPSAKFDDIMNDIEK